ncbi:GSCOCG00005518001-RA-CDS [Cotesia congregata]|uniref:Similar to arx: Gametocyte-specific factor 1 homolog (Drosophila melanogaster) n=1 Tax=Cotesia congregata TaxID=51543 RepID=A0A8J2HCM9_COTCN|nr:GSCOCG00005518001-RA-CDS [Cotesia congregata]CAG5093551.1 Similar to arx: Gametocyte-specific factor 1 homolog (Drosophila melanogaster) [Cotesia congregata]
MAAAYEDPKVTCPIDKSHEIFRSRLPQHLIKCLKANKLVNKMICPYNTTHLININEKEKHLMECESYAKIFIESAEMAEKPNYSGVVHFDDAVDQVTRALEASGIDGQEEKVCFIDGPAYNPEEAKINEQLYRQLNGEAKSARKNFRREEVKRHAELEAKQSTVMQNGGHRSNKAKLKKTHRPTALKDKGKKDDTSEDGSIYQGLPLNKPTEHKISEDLGEGSNVSRAEDDNSGAIASPVRSNKSADLDTSIKSKEELIEDTKTETDNFLEESDYDNATSELYKKYNVHNV